MFDAFAKLLNMSLSASILVLAIILFRLIFKKSSKKIICFLWILVAIRLTCPINLESHISVFNLFHSKQMGTEQPFQFRYSGHSEKPMIEFSVPALVNDNTSSNSMTIGVKKPDFYGPTVAMIWMMGVVAMLAAALISYMNLRKEVTASIQREKNVYVCDEIQSPFILGLFRPTIYLPSGMDESAVKSVLLHEKAHIKRKDYIWKPFGYLLLSVYWFNPVMWIAFILLCRDIEAACDEKVIAGMGREDIAGYTEALLLCAVMKRKITACPVAFGETNVKGRVKNVLNYKKPSFWILSLSLVAGLAVAAGFLTDPVSSLVDAAETEIKELYTDYIGDAPTVAAIAQSLPYPAGYRYASIELQTEKEPYELHIYLSGEGPFEMDDFLKCADYAFDHIGNLSIILFLSEDTGEVLAVHAEPEELLLEETFANKHFNHVSEKEVNMDYIEDIWAHLGEEGLIKNVAGISTAYITSTPGYGGNYSDEEWNTKIGDKAISVHVNEDKSLTFEMTKEQYFDFLTERIEDVNKAFESCIENEKYSIESVEYSNDYSEILLYMEESDLKNSDLSTAYFFASYGMFIRAIIGEKDIENITIFFIAPEGNIIQTIHADELNLSYEVKDTSEHLEEKNAVSNVEFDVNASDGAVSIIGGADGPTSIFLAGKLGDDSEVPDVDDQTAEDWIDQFSKVGNMLLALID